MPAVSLALNTSWQFLSKQTRWGRGWSPLAHPFTTYLPLLPLKTGRGSQWKRAADRNAPFPSNVRRSEATKDRVKSLRRGQAHLEERSSWKPGLFYVAGPAERHPRGPRGPGVCQGGTIIIVASGDQESPKDVTWQMTAHL